MKRLSYTCCVLFMLLSSAASLLCQPPQTGEFTIAFTDTTGDDVTSYISYYVPPDYDSTKSYPLLLFWHGSSDSGIHMRDMMEYLLAERVGGILACPDANNVNGMSSIYFSNLANEAYSYMRDNYNIDSTKLIIGGYSWGGGYAYQLGLLNPDYFTGIIGLAPAIGQLDQEMWDNIMKVRMATILGDLDMNWTAVNALMTNIKSRGANLLYLVKPGVTHNDNEYFQSQEIIDDFRACYDYVTNASTDVKNSDVAANSIIGISPNPASDYLRIEVAAHENEIVDIRLLDLKGIQFYQYNSAAPQSIIAQEIDLRNYPAGVYFAIIKIGREVFYRKIIKVE